MKHSKTKVASFMAIMNSGNKDIIEGIKNNTIKKDIKQKYYVKFF